MHFICIYLESPTPGLWKRRIAVHPGGVIFPAYDS